MHEVYDLNRIIRCEADFSPEDHTHCYAPLKPESIRQIGNQAARSGLKKFRFTHKQSTTSEYLQYSERRSVISDDSSSLAINQFNCCYVDTHVESFSLLQAHSNKGPGPGIGSAALPRDPNRMRVSQKRVIVLSPQQISWQHSDPWPLFLQDFCPRHR